MVEKNRKYPIKLLICNLIILFLWLCNLWEDFSNGIDSIKLILLIGLSIIFIISLYILIKRILVNNGKGTIKTNYLHFPLICIVISLMLFGTAIILGIFNSKIIKDGINQEAIVTKVVMKDSYVYGPDFINIVKYDIYLKYQINNKWYNNVLKYYPYELTVNDKISIYYDPNNYQVITTKELEIFTWVMVFLSGVFAVIAIRSLIINMPIKLKRI